MYLADEKRYSEMKYTNCGKSGLMLPKIALGFWHNFGELNDYKTMKELVFTAFDNGITYFDLANNYGPKNGAAEESLGRILKEELKAYRDEIVIATKAGYPMWDGPYGDGGSRKYLMASLDQSLNRLGVSYVDIFYHHRMTKETPLEETMLALADIVRQGKALYIGLSKYDQPTLRQATKILNDLHVPFIVNQNRYNILDRTYIENGVIDTALELGQGNVVFSPLAQGLLTDRYLDGIPEDSRIKHDPRYLKEDALTPELLIKLKKLNEIAQERNEKLADMALEWILKDNKVTSCIIGASKKEQILINCKAVNGAEFTEDQLKRIDDIVLENQ